MQIMNRRRKWRPRK